MRIDHFIKKGIRTLRTQGVTIAMVLAAEKIRLVVRNHQIRNCGPSFVSANRQESQKSFVFDKKITVSLLTPLYNTPEYFLKDMIESVLAQTYPYWELCMADGSDEAHAYIGDVCREYARMYDCIRYEKLPCNLGISGNTNACVQLAHGEYFGILDHDDILHPCALYETVEAVLEHDADFVYTDEAKFDRSPDKPFDPHCKPEFTMHELCSHNFICHFNIFSRELYVAAGPYESTFDGSQDHDMALRLTEKAHCIVHVPQILYFWRVHSGSVAAGIEAKSYAVEAGKKAVLAHVHRSGENGTVESIPPFASMYRVRYVLKGHPLVSILLHGQAGAASIPSLWEKTAYPQFEILRLELDGERTEMDTDHTFTQMPGESRANLFNRVARVAKGEYLLLLDASARPLSQDWIEEMLMFAQKHDVGAVGAKLYSRAGRILYAGIDAAPGEAPSAVWRYLGVSRHSYGYNAELAFARGTDAVDARCLLCKRVDYLEAGGFREETDFADVDFCLRQKKKGLVCVWTPFAQICCENRRFQWI